MERATERFTDSSSRCFRGRTTTPFLPGVSMRTEVSLIWPPATSISEQHLRTPWEGSLIAPSPLYFSGCGDIQNLIYYERPPYSLTPRGLKIDVHLLKFPGLNFVNSSLIPLNCARITKEGPVLLAIKVCKLSGSSYLYLRDLCAELALNAKMKTGHSSSNQVPVDATAREFFENLRTQSLNAMYIPVQHTARFRLPETLSSEPVDWTETSMKAMRKRLGVAGDVNESTTGQFTTDLDTDADV